MFGSRTKKYLITFFAKTHRIWTPRETQISVVFLVKRNSF